MKLCSIFICVIIAMAWNVQAGENQEAGGAKTEAPQAQEGKQRKVNGDFENGKNRPWYGGYWRAGGGKPQQYSVKVVDNPVASGESKKVLSLKIEGDSTGKRTSVFAYVDIPISVRSGRFLKLTFDYLQGAEKFGLYHVSLTAFKSGKYVMNVPCIRKERIKPAGKSDAWVTASESFEIPQDKMAGIDKLQLRIYMITDNSDAKKVYEGFIDNIIITQK